MYIKAFYNNSICRDLQYEIGKTYKTNKKIEMYKWGFHFFDNLNDTLSQYFASSRYYEIEPGKDIIKGYKNFVSNKITIIRELFLDELIELDGIGKWCYCRAIGTDKEHLYKLEDAIIKKDKTGEWINEYIKYIPCKNIEKLKSALNDIKGAKYSINEVFLKGVKSQ